MNSIRRLERDGRDRSPEQWPGNRPGSLEHCVPLVGVGGFHGRRSIRGTGNTVYRSSWTWSLQTARSMVRRVRFFAAGAIGETRLRTCSAGSSRPTPTVQLQGAATKLTLRHDRDTTCHVAHTVHRRKPTDALSSTSDTVGAASSQLVSKRTLDSIFARPALILSTLDLVRERQHRRRLDADIGLDPRG